MHSDADCRSIARGDGPIKKGSRRPVWADYPAKCLERGLFPMRFTCAQAIKQTAVDEWIKRRLHWVLEAFSKDDS